jgi:hypothetical protein
MAKRKIFDELIEGVDAMKKHREGKLTLRSYKEEVTPLPAVDSKFIRETRKRMRCSRAVFARAAADQRKNAGKMGAGAGQAESSGGSAGSTGAPVSQHAGAAGKVGGRLMRWECGDQIETGKVKSENSEEKIPTHAAHEWGTRPRTNLHFILEHPHLDVRLYFRSKSSQG